MSAPQEHGRAPIDHTATPPRDPSTESTTRVPHPVSPEPPSPRPEHGASNTPAGPPSQAPTADRDARDNAPQPTDRGPASGEHRSPGPLSEPGQAPVGEGPRHSPTDQTVVGSTQGQAPSRAPESPGPTPPYGTRAPGGDQPQADPWRAPADQPPPGAAPVDPRQYGGQPMSGAPAPAEQQWQQPQGQPPYQQPQQWGSPNHPQQQPPPGGVPYQGISPSLDDVPMRRAKKTPGSGWRKAVHHVSGGAVNPGMSAEERRLQELVARIRQPVRGDYRIAVLSLKGGVGKTTTTMGIGSTFASIRGDRVIAVDANPDFGTLSQRVPLQTRSTVRDLLLDPAIQRYSDVRRHTSQATSRLEVLASERDPAASEAFSEEEYRAVARVLQRFYNIILTDCGTGLMHSAMSGVLDLAHSLVLISSPAIDGARSAAATLDWLSLHGHDHLVRNAVVVINSPRAGSPNVGIQELREYFLSRCRAVHIIPFDTHMSEGAEIDLHRLHKQTKRAYVELAATVADDFATDHRRYQP
ncbi:MinD/ParA family ATP-binding protein [Nocardia callitridis]|uniref:MinD/ParA family ATP-binding protein n=1 Tax=Nocardia callitridis TaxID=648753 RepID=UPI003CD07D2C